MRLDSEQLDLIAHNRVGTTIKGKWLLDRLIGVGGMAAVYAATHRNRKRAALKILHREYSEKASIRERFLREGYVANTIGHPGVVRIDDDDVTEDGSVFLIMELVEGETLDERLTREGPLPPDEVLYYFDQVLDTVATAHAKGIVHRDFKPENMLLSADGRVRLLDFGIARVRELTTDPRRTLTEGLMGTPAFMPPEQARGNWAEVDARSDLWSLGASMFTLLTGCYVHDAETPNETLAVAISERAPALASLRPDLPSGLCQVVDRALQYEKDARWPNATVMLLAIRQAATQLSTADDEAHRAQAVLRSARASDPEIEVVDPVDAAPPSLVTPDTRPLSRPPPSHTFEAPSRSSFEAPTSEAVSRAVSSAPTRPASNPPPPVTAATVRAAPPPPDSVAPRSAPRPLAQQTSAPRPTSRAPAPVSQPPRPASSRPPVTKPPRPGSRPSPAGVSTPSRTDRVDLGFERNPLASPLPAGDASAAEKLRRATDALEVFASQRREDERLTDDGATHVAPPTPDLVAQTEAFAAAESPAEAEGFGDPMLDEYEANMARNEERTLEPYRAEQSSDDELTVVRPNPLAARERARHSATSRPKLQSEDLTRPGGPIPSAATTEARETAARPSAIEAPPAFVVPASTAGPAESPNATGVSTPVPPSNAGSPSPLGRLLRPSASPPSPPPPPVAEHARHLEPARMVEPPSAEPPPAELIASQAELVPPQAELVPPQAELAAPPVTPTAGSAQYLEPTAPPRSDRRAVVDATSAPTVALSDPESDAVEAQRAKDLERRRAITAASRAPTIITSRPPPRVPAPPPSSSSNVWSLVATLIAVGGVVASVVWFVQKGQNTADSSETVRATDAKLQSAQTATGVPAPSAAVKTVKILKKAPTPAPEASEPAAQGPKAESVDLEELPVLPTMQVDPAKYRVMQAKEATKREFAEQDPSAPSAPAK